MEDLRAVCDEADAVPVILQQLLCWLAQTTAKALLEEAPVLRQRRVPRRVDARAPPCDLDAGEGGELLTARLLMARSPRQ